VGPISKQPPPPLPPLPESFKSMTTSSVPASPMERQNSQSPRASVEPISDQFSRLGMSPNGPASVHSSPSMREHSQPPPSSHPSPVGPPGQSFGPGQIMSTGQSFTPGQLVNSGQVLGPSRSVSMASHRSYDSMRPGPGPVPGPSMNNPHSMMQSPMSTGPQGDPMRRGPPPLNSGPNFPPQQPFARPVGPGMSSVPPRPPSAPTAHQNGLRKAPSTHSLSSASIHDEYRPPPSAPPLPRHPGGFPPHYSPNFSPGPGHGGPTLYAPQPRPLLPSAQLDLSRSSTHQSFAEPSPPNSPVDETPSLPPGPVTATVSATMKCKVFLKQQHAQWKSLGSAKLKVYKQSPTNIKQLVVEADNKDKSVLISTIVLSDGVERVGKTGVAVEISDQGRRTGIVYMIQLRNENSAGGLFDSLLEGSDRSR